jgi:hypothetical protein
MRQFSKLKLLQLCFILSIVSTVALSQSDDRFQIYPYSVNDTHLTIWNGQNYSPLFIKGVNLGVAVPGTFPGELAATSQQYAEWFQLIREAGFNTIRVYTIHYPRFYQELRKFNLANPNSPLLLFHGVWLEEELIGYNEDLYFLTESFNQEIQHVVDVVHGNAIIPPSNGKASGTFTSDVSPWVIGYIAGREIHPPEVEKTNSLHPEDTSYEGEYLSIDGVKATESWLISKLDFLLTYEMENYGTQRPVSISSWPTMDPLTHPSEQNRYEDSESIDFQRIDFSKASAGFFVSYHAYPYYPRFVSHDPAYQGFSDYFGQNSYLGYLTYLKQHYPRFPLIIAEYGTASSWGVAKYANNGIHHGGLSEKEQGEAFIRLLNTTDLAGTGGGIAFAWIDEWFKRTWITDPYDFDIERRIIWHNVTAAEQNFGLVGFRKAFDGYFRWQDFTVDDPISSLDVTTDFAYFMLKLNIPTHISESDTIWIALDTYDPNLGESVLPNGKVVQNRAEFALRITNYSAELFVTRAYDTYGIWHDTSEPSQRFQSTVSDAGDWRLVRWKNDTASQEAQDIGSMRVTRLGTPPSSLDGVRLYEDRIEVRLPWTLLHFIDPSRAIVLHDDRSTPIREVRQSDGINVGLYYREMSTETSIRYVWEPWNHALNAEMFLKASYNVVKEELGFLSGNPVAKMDSYQVGIEGPTLIQPENGLLVNDWSLDGSSMIAVLTENPINGVIQLNENGSFSYLPNIGFTGNDSFRYRVNAGGKLSEVVQVTLDVNGVPQGTGFVKLYPNPTADIITVSAPVVIDRISVFSVLGHQLFSMDVNATEARFEMKEFVNGVYFVQIFSGRDVESRKFLKMN